MLGKWKLGSVSLPKRPSASEAGVQPPILGVSQLQLQFGGSSQSQAQQGQFMQQSAPPLYSLQNFPANVEMLT